MNNEHAPPGSHWRFDQKTRDFVLTRAAMSNEPKGEYTSDHMMKDLHAIARNEANNMPDRLQAYGLMLKMMDVLFSIERRGK